MIEIRTFGGLRIRRGEQPIARFPTRKVEALLVYLACQGRPCPRETLADLLWDDRPQAQAQTNLRATLSRLNRQLPEALTITRHTVAANMPNVWLDTAALEAGLAHPTQDPARAEQALKLYTGDFLAGFAVRDSRGIDDWLLLERERLRQRALDAYGQLAALCLDQGRYAEGVQQAHRLVSLDPLREEAHRQLMMLLALNGERGAALTQYERCRQVLEEQLGVEPSAETTAIFHRIEHDEVGPRTTAAAIGERRRIVRLINPLPQDIGTRFIGQADKRAAILGAIAGEARLVSIYGRGGIGKTALACKVMSDLQSDPAGAPVDGLVALSALMGGIRLDRILVDVGRLLGGQAERLLAAVAKDDQMPAARKISVLLEQVRGGRYVLLLDNLESQQEAISGELADHEMRTLFEMVLEQSSALCLLITSREPLALPRPLKTWERLVPLEDGLPLDEACALLRTFDPSGAAGLRDAPEALLRRLAERTHGYPRALEAAAGLLLETPLLRLEELAADPDLLTAEVTPTIVQQAIASLGSEVVQVMEALALFGRPVPLAALEFLLAPFTPTANLRAILNRLVRAYFVRFDKSAQHFALHPIDQEYCASRIPEGEEGYTRRGLHQRAAQYFRHQRKPQAEWTALEDVEPQLSEFEHLIRAGEYDAAAGVLLAIDRDYLWEWGQQSRLKAMHARLQGRLADARLIRASRRRLAWTWWPNLAEAAPLFEQNLASARKDGDRQHEADALDDLAQVDRNRNDSRRAIELHQQALNLYRAVGDQRGEGDALGGIGVTAIGLGQAEWGLAFSEQAAAIHRALNHQPSLGFTLWSMGTANRFLGRFEQAAAHYATAVGIYQEINAPRGMANNLAAWAAACASLDQFELAFDCLRQALEIAHALQDEDGIGMAQTYWGGALVMMGKPSEAVDILQGARTAIWSNVTRDFNDFYLVQALIATNQAEAALQVMTSRPAPPHPAFAIRQAVLTGVAQILRHDWDAARASFQIGQGHASQLIQGASRFEAFYLRGLAHTGLALLDQDDTGLTGAVIDFASAWKESAAPGVRRAFRQVLEALISGPDEARFAPVRAALADEDA